MNFAIFCVSLNSFIVVFCIEALLDDLTNWSLNRANSECSILTADITRSPLSFLYDSNYF